MFYYPNVLQRHTGCFSTIWLAATKGIRITRRELMKVNVGRTCEDILDYVTVRMPPLHPSLPRPRFSLYLSSQLQYGIVIVFHRQCAFLLDEVQQIIDRLLRSERHMRIDMAEPDRLALDVPDSLLLLREAEGAQDPFFGVMGLEQELPSPYKMPQPWQLMDTVTPQRFLVDSLRSAQNQEGFLSPPGFRSPPAGISLQEKEPLVILEPEFAGAELPDATATEIDLLLEQPDLFLRGEADQERTTERATTSIDQLMESVLGQDRDGLWLQDEQADQPLKVITAETTPQLVATPPALASSEREGRSYGEGDTPSRKPGRRRQLIFADPHVQISQDAMRVQIGDPLAETLPLSRVLMERPSTTKTLPAVLFSAPAGPHCHSDLLSLWKQCAVLTTLPRSGERRGEGEGGASSSVLGREVVRRSSRREVPRELVESGLQSEASALAVSGIQLDVSKEDRSLDQITPASRWSPQDEQQGNMEPIVEEHVPLPEGEAGTGSWDVSTQEVLRLVTSCLQTFGQAVFHSLLPPEAERGTAASVFYSLLELVSERKLAVSQAQPYGPISIHHAQLTWTC
ncbi:REC8 meiotic recombination protein b [Hypomesus transpacificus]|uniref:REC8 meiotic recombination protein b n=1 Tax=Hypomesus transpacificus TaxID=137520 RepID=UPI001F07B2B7|nr:REC8 meiotic recombination protein b [Hypomesus transpacificus]